MVGVAAWMNTRWPPAIPHVERTFPRDGLKVDFGLIAAYVAFFVFTALWRRSTEKRVAARR
jgi:hypothetical protein